MPSATMVAMIIADSASRLDFKRSFILGTSGSIALANAYGTRLLADANQQIIFGRLDMRGTE
jgi:hypothetical protein